MQQIPPAIFLLEFLPEDSKDADPALISAIGNDVATLLREQGENIQPVYSGQRGGDLLLQLINTAWANRDIILSDLSSLIAILTPVVQLVLHIRHVYIQRVGKEVAQQHPATIALELKGMTLMIEATTPTDATEMATQLAQQILAQSQPSSDQVKLLSSSKVQVRIPKRSIRKRR